MQMMFVAMQGYKDITMDRNLFFNISICLILTLETENLKKYLQINLTVVVLSLPGVMRYVSFMFIQYTKKSYKNVKFSVPPPKKIAENHHKTSNYIILREEPNQFSG